MQIVTRQEKTLDGLRSRLYDTLDKVIDGKIESANVECICAVSEQIIKSAQLEVDTILRLEENKRKERIEQREATTRLEGIMNAITISKETLESTT